MPATTCGNCSSAREGTLGIVSAVVLRLFPKPRSVCTGLCAVDDYAAVLELLQHARSGFGSQLTAFEVMWPDFYRVGTEDLGRKPPLDPVTAFTSWSRPWASIPSRTRSASKP